MVILNFFNLSLILYLHSQVLESPALLSNWNEHSVSTALQTFHVTLCLAGMYNLPSISY